MEQALHHYLDRIAELNAEVEKNNKGSIVSSCLSAAGGRDTGTCSDVLPEGGLPSCSSTSAPAALECKEKPDLDSLSEKACSISQSDNKSEASAANNNELDEEGLNCQQQRARRRRLVRKERRKKARLTGEERVWDLLLDEKALDRKRSMEIREATMKHLFAELFSGMQVGDTITGNVRLSKCNKVYIDLGSSSKGLRSDVLGLEIPKGLTRKLYWGEELEVILKVLDLDTCTATAHLSDAEGLLGCREKAPIESLEIGSMVTGHVVFIKRDKQQGA